ncbi:hypothetical protein H8E77_39885 [bacterium]|nr:hypothetical protein [bacterium]
MHQCSEERTPFSTPTWAELVGTFNRLIDEGKMKEMLLVMPNTRTKYGGSWYVNSALQGNYIEFLWRPYESIVA